MLSVGSHSLIFLYFSTHLAFNCFKDIQNFSEKNIIYIWQFKTSLFIKEVSFSFFTKKSPYKNIKLLRSARLYIQSLRQQYIFLKKTPG